MPRVRRLSLIAAFVAVGAGVSGCGSQGISVPADQQAAAETFVRSCSGCHTLAAAGTQGSAVNVRTREYKDGPNFDQRTETKECVLFAIRNGGFSSGPMPQNIVTGKAADELAQFVAEHSKQPDSGSGPTVDVPGCPAG